MIARRVVRGQTLSFPSDPNIAMKHAAPSPSGATAASCGRGPTAVCRRSIAGLRSMTTAIAWSCRGSSMRNSFPAIQDARRTRTRPARLAPPLHVPRGSAYRNSSYAEHAAGLFLDLLFANGTTSALAFCSVHKACAEALFQAAETHNMAIATGKTMMDRNAVPAVHDTPEQGARDSEKLLVKWHGRGRARYAVTPRFAITSSEAQLRLSGELLKSHPEALLQSHLSESLLEIATLKGLFPNDADYTAVYDRFGLLGTRSFFAHGVHLSERECARLHETGSKVVHCPTSNTFLGSGLFDIANLRKASRPVGVGLATDVGGGTSYSMLATMAEAYRVACSAEPG